MASCTAVWVIFQPYFLHSWLVCCNVLPYSLSRMFSRMFLCCKYFSLFVFLLFFWNANVFFSLYAFSFTTY